MERHMVRLHLPPGNTGYTYSHSSSYSSSTLDHEKEQGVALQPPVMSRRSLRIHSTGSPAYGEDSLLDGSLPYGHTSFSQRDAKGLKSRRSQQLLSVSCSQSLLLHPHHQTPRKPSSQSLHNSSLLSVASSASMLSSSLLDESCIQETTLVDSGWGLDHDFDPQETTIHSQDGSALTNSTLLNSTLTASRVGHCPHHPGQTQGSMANGHYCKDCALHSDRKEALTTTTRRISSSSSSAGVTGGVQSGASEWGLASTPPSTIYCRKKSRKTGVLVSMWDCAVRVSRGAVASVAYLLTLLYHSVLLRIHQYGKGVVRSVLSSSLLYGRRAAASTVSVLSLALQASRAALFSLHSGAKTKADVGSEKVVNGAHSSYCGSMDVKELGTDGGRRLNLHRSLCSSLLWLTQRAASASRAVSKRLLSAVWLLTGSPGKAASHVSRWLGRGWHHLVTFMSLLKVFLLQQCLPQLPRLLLILFLPLLLFFSLWWFGPSGLLSVLPAVNVSDWRTALPFTGLSSLYAFTSAHSQAAGSPVEDAADSQAYREPPYSPPPAADSQAYREPPYIPPPAAEDGSAVSVDPERLLRVEQSLSQLWGRVEGGGRRAEQTHGEMLRLYRTLEQQLHSASDRESMEPWVADLLDHRLDHRLDKLSGRMEEERALREQTRQQYATQQQSQASRLAEMELLLQTLAAKTEEIQRRQEAAATDMPTDTPTDAALPAPISVGVDRESHDALLAEVERLEAALGDVRQDLQGLMGCQDTCGRLDGLQETILAQVSSQVSSQVSAQVSAQVREDLRALFYGNQLMTATTMGSESLADPVDLPDSLLQWLTERYVTGADLQASLASLELSILQNVSLQLERHSGEETPCTETVSQTVAHTMGAAGATVTQEEVQLIVKNALRLYSQDQTGLADFALESGGGSILSTRCSETYETKTALMSLFGLPLWYFSQSPRVVIQPDVHPGNCWAFKGSHGYLVIRLSMRVRPTAFSVEHIPKALAPSGSLRSAPRDFTVYGLDNESQEHGKLLGSYTYQEDGEAVQTYHVSEQNDKAFQIIEVQVQSNWGHEEYTCMYRFRVHGTPSSN